MIKEENESLRWVGYVCTGCGIGVRHHADWDIFCPRCHTLIKVHETIKIKEV